MDAERKTTLSEAEYERLTLAYWLTRVSDLEDVTVIVRRRNRTARTTVVFEPPVTRPASSDAPPRPSPAT